MDQLEYYAYLAATVPAANLARAAARKLARRASQVLWQRPEPDDGELLSAFCALDGRDLALKLCAPRASRLWADSARREALVSVAGQVPGLVGRVLERAEAAWRREFRFFGAKVRFGRGGAGIDWSLDPIHGARFDAEGMPTRPGLDPKCAWAVGRFEQLLALAQGVWVSPCDEDRARWCEEFVAQVRSFVRDCPLGVGVQWASPMEVALRATNLTLAFLMLRHRPELQSADFALAMSRLLLSSGRFVEAHLEDTGAVPNNHFVANLVGLLHLGVVFPELPGAKGWRAIAAAGLREQIELQVLDDGFCFEGSTGYHRLSTELFTLALFAAHAGRVELGERFAARLQAMYRAASRYLSPGGLAPQFGDNDSGRGLPLRERASLDHGYLLPLGAALFRDPELKLEGCGYCDEALFLMGPAGLERFEALAVSGLRRSGSLPRAGLYVLRSGEAFCAVSCGPNGQAGVGGHGHNDKLGLEVHHGAVPLVVDPGSPCYTDNPRLRNLYRSTSAHSTLQVDGEEQSRLPETRLFALPDQARARMVCFESTPVRERFAGEHHGYERLSAPLIHRREVVLDRGAQGFLVLDRLAGGGVHVATVRFHLPDAQARPRAATPAERERCARLVAEAELNLEQVFELGPPEKPSGLLVTSARGRTELRRFLYSPGYGERQEARCAELRVEAELPFELAAVILLLPEAGGEGE